MISRAWSRKSIAICLSVAVLSVYSMVVLAAPGQGVSGELSISGATPSQVSVNGQLANSGLTVLTGSLITTGPENSAVVSLGKLGRVELAPNTSLSLSFNETGVSGQLSSGRLMVSTNNGIASVITTNYNIVIGATIDGLYLNVETGANNGGSTGGGSTVPGWDINVWSSSSMSFFSNSTDMPNGYFQTTGGTGTSNLGAGALVDAATGVWQSGAATASGIGAYTLNARNYFGFRFKTAGGATNYGYMAIDIGSAQVEPAWAAQPVPLGR